MRGHLGSGVGTGNYHLAGSFADYRRAMSHCGFSTSTMAPRFDDYVALFLSMASTAFSLELSSPALIAQFLDLFRKYGLSPMFEAGFIAGRFGCRGISLLSRVSLPPRLSFTARTNFTFDGAIKLAAMLELAPFRRSSTRFFRIPFNAHYARYRDYRLITHACYGWPTGAVPEVPRPQSNDIRASAPPVDGLRRIAPSAICAFAARLNSGRLPEMPRDGGSGRQSVRRCALTPASQAI